MWCSWTSFVIIYYSVGKLLMIVLVPIFVFVTAILLDGCLDFYAWICIYRFFWYQQRRRLITHANAKSKSEKFPPPHQDGALGYPLDSSHHNDPSFDNSDASFSTVFPHQKGPATAWSGPLIDTAAAGQPKRKKQIAVDALNQAVSKQFGGANPTRETHKDKGSARFR